MSGLGSGFVNLFKSWGKGIGKAADNFLLKADARKAISDEVINKFQPMIERAQRYESKRAANIKDLGDKLTQSKKDLADAQKAWQDKYDNALADAKNQRQTDIADYDAKLKGYQDALDTAKADRQNIINNLYDQEATYTPTKTIFTDVSSGERYIVNPITGKYENITQIFSSANKKQKQAINQYIKGFDERLLDNSSGTPRVLNAFDEATRNKYKGNSNIYDNYLGRLKSSHNGDMRNAYNQIKQANDNLSAWQTNKRPADWDDKTDLASFGTDFEKINGAKPTGYSFNGKNYSDETALDAAYQKALNHAQYKRDYFRTKASNYASERDKEIAKRIQDAKDIKKAKLALGALGAGAGAGALYAGAKAMYGGDDTPDNTDNTNNIDNTDNTDYGKPDPGFNVEKEGQAILKDRQQVDTDFNPDTADALAAAATLADAAHDTGVEDSNSIESSGDLGNNIAATTGGHTMEDRLYELIKAMEDPYKADAVANYIYSRHGDDPEVQRLGWRGWLNKYYGDSLRSIMNRDPSSYKGMHVSGGL